MHLRLSICFYSDESKALKSCEKRNLHAVAYKAAIRAV